MTKYRKKPVVIEAHQWFKNGDHPEDDAMGLFDYPDGVRRLQVVREGTVVRYYSSQSIDGKVDCHICQRPMQDHGWIDTLEGGFIVCPGDFIITGVQGERYPSKPDIFEATYELVNLEVIS
jgi:hypothetical protein